LISVYIIELKKKNIFDIAIFMCCFSFLTIHYNALSNYFILITLFIIYLNMDKKIQYD